MDEVNTEASPKTETPAAPAAAEVKPDSESSQNEQSFREALAQNVEKAEAKTESERPKQPNQYTKKDGAKTTDAAPIVPPADMTPAEKESFLKLSPEGQAYLSRRAYENRSTLSREMQKIQDRGKQFDSMEAVLAPNREWLATRGITETDLLRRAIGWEQKIEREGVPAAREWLAAQGIDPWELIEDNGARPNGNQNGQHQQMNVQELRESIREEILGEIRGEQEKNQQAATTAQHFNLVEKFKEDKALFKDPATAELLERKMAPIIQAIVQANPSTPPEKALDQAYNYVTKGDPTFSSLLDGFAERQRAEKARKEAEVARQNSRSISGGLSGGSRSSEGLTFSEEVRLRMNGGM